ncbi:MAG TPA: hypothetical protein VFM91_00540 [Propionibacteriaceae bacterium]|nr:hypothetical protein [Propionibacteriaceae bacterium]
MHDSERITRQLDEAGLRPGRGVGSRHPAPGIDTDAIGISVWYSCGCTDSAADDGGGVRDVGAKHPAAKWCTPSGSTVDRGSVFAVVSGIAVGVLVAIWCATTVPEATMPGGWWLFGLGITLMWVGIVPREWAVWSWQGRIRS